MDDEGEFTTDFFLYWHITCIRIIVIVKTFGCKSLRQSIFGHNVFRRFMALSF